MPRYPDWTNLIWVKYNAYTHKINALNAFCWSIHACARLCLAHTITHANSHSQKKTKKQKMRFILG